MYKHFKVIAFFGLLTVCLCSFVSADSSSGAVGSPGGRGGRRAGGKRMNPGSKGSIPGLIKGVCVISESVSNPIAGPCTDLLLILNDEDGNEVEKTRTSPQGKFEFAAEEGKDYLIISGSKFYDVVAPSGTIHGGSKVNLQLRQK